MPTLDSNEELRNEMESLINDAVADLGMSVLFKDSDPVDTGVGDKNPPYYWTDKVLFALRQAYKNGYKSGVSHDPDGSISCPNCLYRTNSATAMKGHKKYRCMYPVQRQGVSLKLIPGDKSEGAASLNLNPTKERMNRV